jgi:hypothetical protein
MQHLGRSFHCRKVKAARIFTTEVEKNTEMAFGLFA